MRETSRTVSESETSVALAVTRTAHTGDPLTVDFAAQAGTATSGDFVAASGTLSWAAGEYNAKSINITLAPDTAVEGAESFSVVLSNPSNGAQLGHTTTQVNINDDDVPAPTGGGSGGGGGGGGGGALGLLSFLGLIAAVTARARRCVDERCRVVHSCIRHED